VLESWEGEQSGGIDTTLDADVQRAAENALTGLPGNAYLVAVDPASGQILAAANASGNTGDDRAFTGSYKPGGTFGMVAALAALESGAATPTSDVPCGPSVEIGGQTFTNPSQGSLSFGPTLVRIIAFACKTRRLPGACRRRLTSPPQRSGGGLPAGCRPRSQGGAQIRRGR
jgi:cell division protein FtsI/penicillin-binding protein 2